MPASLCGRCPGLTGCCTRGTLSLKVLWINEGDYEAMCSVISMLYICKMPRVLFFLNCFFFMKYTITITWQTDLIWFDFWCLTPLSAIFQLYHCDQILVMEEAGVPGENHRPWASNLKTLSLAAASRMHPFCNLQSRVRTQAVLVIDLYELLGNSTT